MIQLELPWWRLTEHELLGLFVFLALIRYELERACVHGHWDPELGGFCWYCDTGMST